MYKFKFYLSCSRCTEWI